MGVPAPLQAPIPALAIGAFAGLRAAEIQRLEWSDIDLVGRHITVGATTNRAKNASRRVVPVADNLAAWLAAYPGREGRIWSDGPEAFHRAQRETVTMAKVKRKANSLRQSFAGERSRALRKRKATGRC